jgi:tetratricopeptide (TPR) repeat protein
MAKDPLENLRKQAQEAISKGQYQEARQIYQQALGYRSDSPEIHYGIATVCFLLGDSHSAVYHFKEVIRIDPLRAGAYINLGAVYNRLGQYEESLAILRRGIQLDTNRAEGYYNLALVYKQLGQLDMGINAYREAVRLNPRMYDAHYNLGNIFFEKGQLALAIAHYKQALEIRPNWEKGKKALETAQAVQGTETPAATVSTVPSPPAVKLDPARTLDSLVHGALLRDIHDIVIDTDKHSQLMLEFLQKEVEQAIRELSITILAPKDPRYNLDEQMQKFDGVVTQLKELQDALEKRMERARTLGEHLART